MAATETLLTVRTEVLARGFDDLDSTRTNRIINDAYQWVLSQALWPFREATASGAAPLTIADIGVLGSVTDTANGSRKLEWTDRRTLVEHYNDLTVTGAPRCFYIEGGTVVKTYPVGGTLSVRYWKDAAKLTADGDILIIPDKWVQVVIDRACWRACVDRQDWAGATTLAGVVDSAMAAMLLDQLAQQASDPDRIVIYGGEGR